LNIFPIKVASKNNFISIFKAPADIPAISNNGFGTNARIRIVKKLFFFIHLLCFLNSEIEILLSLANSEIPPPIKYPVNSPIAEPAPEQKARIKGLRTLPSSSTTIQPGAGIITVADDNKEIMKTPIYPK